MAGRACGATLLAPMCNNQGVVLSWPGWLATVWGVLASGLGGGASPLPLPSGVSKPQKAFLASTGVAMLLPRRAGHKESFCLSLPLQQPRAQCPFWAGPAVCMPGDSMLKETGPSHPGRPGLGGMKWAITRHVGQHLEVGAVESGCPRRGTGAFLEG